MDEFTPGPWAVYPEELRGGKYWVVVRDGGHDTIDLQAEENGEADAHLIGAAPDMHEVLKSAPILSEYHGQSGFEVERFIKDYGVWRSKAYAVRAKAEGRS